MTTRGMIHCDRTFSRSPITGFERSRQVSCPGMSQGLAAWVARALSRGTQREEREYEDNYTKQNPVVNEDCERPCLQVL